MATPVEVPKLGNTVEECLIGKWLRHKGQTVSAGEVVVEIETDKTTFEVAAPVSGTLLETFFEEGALVPVFTNLFVVGDPGEGVEAFRPARPQETGRPERPGPEGTQPEGLPHKLSHKLSPRASRFAAEHDFHPAEVKGSGPGGRVLEEDLRRLYHRPVPGIRGRIARRMRESLATTAQYTLHSSAEATGLLALRGRLKAAGSDINLNDLVAFCAIRALLEIPALNAELIDGRIRERAEIHLGFACDTPRGLLVPVVRDAHRLTVGELAAAMKDLAARALEGTLSPDDLSGATFTISNLGSLGIESFTPILNPPQVAILGVDALQVKPARRGERIEFIDFIGLSLTCDHQAIDGAPGARFLRAVAEKIEKVESICQEWNAEIDHH
jgi:pyruvate dehydrogenase E2 component (dihydrolipoamide acetyltransferase)